MSLAARTMCPTTIKPIVDDGDARGGRSSMR
jgi:hypothetical protein